MLYFVVDAVPQFLIQNPTNQWVSLSLRHHGHLLYTAYSYVGSQLGLMLLLNR